MSHFTLCLENKLFAFGEAPAPTTVKKLLCRPSTASKLRSRTKAGFRAVRAPGGRRAVDSASGEKSPYGPRVPPVLGYRDNGAGIPAQSLAPAERKGWEGRDRPP